MEAEGEALGRGERESRAVPVPPRSSEARGSSGVGVPGALEVREGAAVAEARARVNVGALRVHVPPRSSEARGYIAVAVPARAADPMAAFAVPLAGGLALPLTAPPPPGDTLTLIVTEGLSESASAVRVTRAGVALAKEAVKEAEAAAERDAREPLEVGVEEVESLKDPVGLMEPVRRAEGEGSEFVGIAEAEGSGLMVWVPVGGLEGAAERDAEEEGREEAEAEATAAAVDVAPPRSAAAPALAEMDADAASVEEGGAEGAPAAEAACAALPEGSNEAVAAAERLRTCDGLGTLLALPEGEGVPVCEPLARRVGAGESDPTGKPAVRVGDGAPLYVGSPEKVGTPDAERVAQIVKVRVGAAVVLRCGVGVKPSEDDAPEVAVPPSGATLAVPANSPVMDGVAAAAEGDAVGEREGTVPEAPGERVVSGEPESEGCAGLERVGVREAMSEVEGNAVEFGERVVGVVAEASAEPEAEREGWPLDEGAGERELSLDGFVEGV